MANYIKFRYTFLEEKGSPKLTKQLIRIYINDYLKIFDAKHLVVGFERKNNCGEETHPHIHIHFTTEKKIETIRKALTRKWKDEGEERTRASLYCLKQEDDVIDKNRFFRYPLKQGSQDFMEVNEYPEDFDVSIERVLAMEHWNTSVEVNRQKLETVLSKESTFDKLVKYLDNLEIKSYELVLKNVLNYYKENKLAMNIATMAGYSLTYCSINNLISDEVILKKMEDKIFN